MIVIVVGGRKSDPRKVMRWLDQHAYETPMWEGLSIHTIIHGGAKGADEGADQWGKAKGIPVIVYPADWEVHGKAAGPMRNQAMIDSKPDLVIAFPGGKGTADCVRRAKAAGIRVIEVGNARQKLLVRLST